MKFRSKLLIIIAMFLLVLGITSVVIIKKMTPSSTTDYISETVSASDIESETISASETKTETESETISETESEIISESRKESSSVMNKQPIYTDGKGNLYEILKEYTSNDGRELVLFQNIRTKTVSLAIRNYFYTNYYLVEN